MFGIFNNSKTDKRKKPHHKNKRLQASCEGVNNQEGTIREQTRTGKTNQGTGSQSDSAGDIRAQALANARAARERLGDDTIQKIAEIIARKENNPYQQAKRKLEAVDSDRLADEILYMLDQD